MPSAREAPRTFLSREKATAKVQAALDAAERGHAHRAYQVWDRGSWEAGAGWGRAVGKGKERLRAALRKAEN